MRHAYFGPRSFPQENEVVGDFVSSLIWGEPGRVEKFCSMGVFDGPDLVAGTLYHNWQPSEGVIELTSASTTPRWLQRPIIKAMFSLPFDRLDVRLTVLRVSEKNRVMRSIARRFGFSETIIPRLRGPDEAECVYTLSAQEWADHKMNR